MTGVTIADALAKGRPTISFEFFPPKDDAGEESLWATMGQLERIAPTFVSVTYGAGGSNRDRTIALTTKIAHNTQLLPMGHLTCVGQDRKQLRTVIDGYSSGGVNNILALRGDPLGGPGQPWQGVPEGLNHAIELVELIAEQSPNISIGVAAFPHGHPEAKDLDTDAEVLASKARAGASFAITQFFYDITDYLSLVDRVASKGIDIPIVPGIMPIESLRQVEKMAELSGADVPAHVRHKIEVGGEDRETIRKIGIEIAAELSQDLLDAGAPGLHFYTLNKSRATQEVFAMLTINR